MKDTGQGEDSSLSSGNFGMVWVGSSRSMGKCFQGVNFYTKIIFFLFIKIKYKEIFLFIPFLDFPAVKVKARKQRRDCVCVYPREKGISW